MDKTTIYALLITGIGATLVMDFWSLFQRYVLRIAPLNYALVGRWLLGLPGGKVCHHTILAAPPLRGEVLVGWGFHYLSGILFATLPLWLHGPDWYQQPSLTVGLLTGLITLLAPFLIMQPALGFGLAASRTPNPWRARMMSVLTHLAYGVGLYLAAVISGR